MVAGSGCHRLTDTVLLPATEYWTKARTEGTSIQTSGMVFTFIPSRQSSSGRSNSGGSGSSLSRRTTQPDTRRLHRTPAPISRPASCQGIRFQWMVVPSRIFLLSRSEERAIHGRPSRMKIKPAGRVFPEGEPGKGG